jgi:hypothetical protein
MEASEEDGVCYGFDIGAYDPRKTLILDPVILVYCGYIGGSEYEEARDVKVDSSGHAYVTGFTKSTQSTFPVVTGPDLSYNGGVFGGDVFVAKLSPDGASLLYCGYIGGSNDEYAYNMALDLEGNAYVTGETKSNQATFPVTVGPDLSYNGGDRDIFVAKVSSDGTSLHYCGYIGGLEEDMGFGITVDDTGHAYVTAHTLSTELSFPVVVGPDLSHNGMWDTIVAKVSADGSGLDYCGYLGGDVNDFGFEIDVDPTGAAYVSGFTYSKSSTFPVKIGPDLTHNGKTDAFVAKVNADGTGLDYCGYIGGDEFEECHGVAVDEQGFAYVTGWTRSTESSFPVSVGPDLSYNGWYWDAFVAKVGADGSELDYCGYIGGDADDHGEGIAVNSDGRACVTGRTNSTESSFPVKVGPDVSHNGGYSDAFVTRVSADGTDLEYCGYIGGDKGDFGEGIALDAFGNAYVAGATYSFEESFPVLVGPDLSFNGDEDAFIAKIAMALAADGSTISAGSGGTVRFALSAGIDNAGRNYLLLGGISGTEPGIPLPGGHATLPLNWDLFTNLVINMANGPFFQDFLGTLDGYGSAMATLNVPPFPCAAGFPMYYAYALNKPYDFVSNPVTIELVP